MAIDFNLDRQGDEAHRRSVEDARATYGAAPDIELVGTMEIHATDVLDIALGTTSEVVPTRTPDIELVGTCEVAPHSVSEAPTPSQLLGEGEHEATAVVDWRSFSEPPGMPAARVHATYGAAPDIELVGTCELSPPSVSAAPTPSQLLGEGEHEQTAVVDWRSFSEPPGVPAASSATWPPDAKAARVPEQREPAGTAPVAPVVAAPTNGPAARSTPVRVPTPERELPAVPTPAPQASTGAGSVAVDALTASSVLAGQYAVLTEVVVAMLTAMPDRDAVLRLAVRNAERMRDFPPSDGTATMWQEGVDRELEGFRDLAAALKHRKSV